MLFEADVVDAVCLLLQTHGYHIIQRLQTTQQGDDIIATKQRPIPYQLYIEAKGETSSRHGSGRYGRAFDSAQVRVHVAEAFYKAAETLARKHTECEVRVGIALPDTAIHRACVKKIEPILYQLGIALFWVQMGGQVQLIAPWDL